MGLLEQKDYLAMKAFIRHTSYVIYSLRMEIAKVELLRQNQADANVR